MTRDIATLGGFQADRDLLRRRFLTWQPQYVCADGKATKRLFSPQIKAAMRCCTCSERAKQAYIQYSTGISPVLTFLPTYPADLIVDAAFSSVIESGHKHRRARYEPKKGNDRGDGLNQENYGGLLTGVVGYERDRNPPTLIT